MTPRFTRSLFCTGIPGPWPSGLGVSPYVPPFHIGSMWVMLGTAPRVTYVCPEDMVCTCSGAAGLSFRLRVLSP